MSEVQRVKEFLEELAYKNKFQLAMVEQNLIHTVALRCLEFRKARGLSQKELAEALRVKKSVIVRLEAGERDIKLSMLARLAFVLGKLPEDLVQGYRSEA